LLASAAVTRISYVVRSTIGFLCDSCASCSNYY